jgi:hypothetical protein
VIASEIEALCPNRPSQIASVCIWSLYNTKLGENKRRIEEVEPELLELHGLHFQK